MNKGYLVLIVIAFFSFLSINADSNGIWLDAKDIKGGNFGSDENSDDFNFFGLVTFNEIVDFNKYVNLNNNTEYKGVELEDLFVNENQVNSITSTMIVDNSITSNKIQDGTILSGDVANGSITSENILDGTIKLTDIDQVDFDAKYSTIGYVDGYINSAVQNTFVADSTYYIISNDLVYSAATTRSKGSSGCLYWNNAKGFRVPADGTYRIKIDADVNHYSDYINKLIIKANGVEIASKSNLNVISSTWCGKESCSTSYRADTSWKTYTLDLPLIKKGSEVTINFVVSEKHTTSCSGSQTLYIRNAKLLGTKVDPGSGVPGVIYD